MRAATAVREYTAKKSRAGAMENKGDVRRTMTSLTIYVNRATRGRMLTQSLRRRIEKDENGESDYGCNFDFLSRNFFDATRRPLAMDSVCSHSSHGSHTTPYDATPPWLQCDLVITLSIRGLAIASPLVCTRIRKRERHDSNQHPHRLAQSQPRMLFQMYSAASPSAMCCGLRRPRIPSTLIPIE